MSWKKKDLKTSIFSRSANLIGMASKVMSSEVGRKINSSIKSVVDEADLTKLRIRQAEILVNHLDKLKGAAMKAGQMLSLDSSGILPDEMTEILSKLQAQSSSMQYEDIIEIAKAELEHFEELSDFSLKAEAAASIGQVHSAKVDDQKVAMKIQYPDIDKSIDSDLAILKNFFSLTLKVYGKDIDLTHLFEEFKTVLEWEVDYERELKQLTRFKELLKDERYVVPTPYPRFSSKKIITMSWEPGIPLSSWIKGNPSYEEREFVGTSLLDLYCQEFYQWGLVQTDPNYGNFLIQTDPLKIVVLDFGATIEYSWEFRERYIKLLKVLESGEPERIRETAIAEGMLDPRESNEACEIFIQLMKQSIYPFQSEQPFYFADPNYENNSREIGLKLTKSLKYSAPPREIVFLHRKLGGLFSLMRKLDLSLDLRPYWQRMSELQTP